MRGWEARPPAGWGEAARPGRARQVLCITHLPQVASLAQRHFRVSKRVGRAKAGASGAPEVLATTRVERLEKAEIVNEVCRMLGADPEDGTARRHAEELLRAAQPAQVDTHNGVIPGRVVRPDPSAINGNVTVDIHLEGDLPQGARPDLSSDGTIEWSGFPMCSIVQRPVFGQPNSLIALFKVERDGKDANRVQVKSADIRETVEWSRA